MLCKANDWLWLVQNISLSLAMPAEFMGCMPVSFD